ncbi:hypothetical protein GBAR_LOCUS15681, partial [Geodia barretti]
PATQPAGGEENTVNLTVWSRAAIIYSVALLGLTIACFWPGIICSAIGYFWAIAAHASLTQGGRDTKKIKTNLAWSFTMTTTALISFIVIFFVLVAVIAAS